MLLIIISEIVIGCYYSSNTFVHNISLLCAYFLNIFAALIHFSWPLQQHHHVHLESTYIDTDSDMDLDTDMGHDICEKNENIDMTRTQKKI